VDVFAWRQFRPMARTGGGGRGQHLTSYARDRSTVGLFGLAPTGLIGKTASSTRIKALAGRWRPQRTRRRFAVMLSIASGEAWQAVTHILSTKRKREVPWMKSGCKACGRIPCAGRTCPPNRSAQGQPDSLVRHLLIALVLRIPLMETLFVSREAKLRQKETPSRLRWTARPAAFPLRKSAIWCCWPNPPHLALARPVRQERCPGVGV